MKINLFALPDLDVAALMEILTMTGTRIKQDGFGNFYLVKEAA